LFNLSTKDNYVYVNNGNKESIGETIQDSIDYFLNEINSEQNDNDGEEDSFNPSHDFTPAFYHQSVKGSLISGGIFNLVNGEFGEVESLPPGTGKSFSEALILASPNPQYAKDYSWNYHEQFVVILWVN
jgi:hypothetical protein